MDKNLDDQIKTAQKDKLLVEVKKIEIEKLKIECEIKNLKNEEKIKYWKLLGSVFLGIIILSFYISYVVDPLSDIKNKTATINNLNNALENAKQRKIIEKQQGDLKVISDSLNIVKQTLKFQNLYIESEKTERLRQVDSFKRISELAGKSNAGNKVQIQKTIDRLNTDLSKQLSSIPNIVGQWYSSIYKGGEIWGITGTSENKKFIVTLQARGVLSSGEAFYKGNGEFTINLKVNDGKHILALLYDWTVNSINPTEINSVFTVISSNDTTTPRGTKQADVLTK